MELLLAARGMQIVNNCENGEGTGTGTGRDVGKRKWLGGICSSLFGKRGGEGQPQSASISRFTWVVYAIAAVIIVAIVSVGIITHLRHLPHFPVPPILPPVFPTSLPSSSPTKAPTPAPTPALDIVQVQDCAQAEAAQTNSTMWVVMTNDGTMRPATNLSRCLTAWGPAIELNAHTPTPTPPGYGDGDGTAPPLLRKTTPTWAGRIGTADCNSLLGQNMSKVEVLNSHQKWKFWGHPSYPYFATSIGSPALAGQCFGGSNGSSAVSMRTCCPEHELEFCKPHTQPQAWVIDVGTPEDRHAPNTQIRLGQSVSAVYESKLCLKHEEFPRK